VDHQPEFKGQQISLRGLDGFFATRRLEPGSALYAICRDAGSSRVACLASNDHGETWYDYAIGQPVQNPYSIGGCREITADGFIVGSFTDSIGSTADQGGGSKVYFFRIRAGRGAPSRLPSTP